MYYVVHEKYKATVVMAEEKRSACGLIVIIGLGIFFGAILISIF